MRPIPARSLLVRRSVAQRPGRRWRRGGFETTRCETSWRAVLRRAVKAIPREVWLYVAVVWGAGALLGGAFWLSGQKVGSPTALAVSTLFMFIPAVAAWAFQRRAGAKVRALGVTLTPNLFWLVAWIGPVVFTLLACAVALLFPGVAVSDGAEGLLAKLSGVLPPEEVEKARTELAKLPVHPALLVIPQALAAGLTINAVAGFGEELGWRGFLHERLSHLGFWRMNLFVGVVWGLWHAPIIVQGHNYPSHPWAGVFVMVAACVPLSVLFGWVRERTRSVLAAAITHGSFNAAAGISTVLLVGGHELAVGVLGAAGIITALLCVAAIAVFDRRFLSTRGAGAPAAAAANAHPAGPFRR